jgi:signal transduction histidine kinase
MFKQLRVQLTLMYLLFALAMVVALGWGSYTLLHYYFNSATDLALQYRMAQELRSLGLTLPPDLQAAETRWLLGRQRSPIPQEATATAQTESQDGNDSEPDNEKSTGAAQPGTNQESLDDAYEGDLAAIFVLPLGSTGQLLFNPNPADPPMQPDLTAVKAAAKNGSDLRTVKLADGSAARLYTFRIPQGGFAYIQLGRQVTDQERVMDQFLIGMGTLGGLAALFLVAAAWWLSGRSIAPAQHAYEVQRTFVANASHELRTPLTLIRASVEIAQRQTINLQHRTLLADVLLDCDYMTKLVEDLLTLSRLDNQRVVLHPDTIQLSRFLPEIGSQVDKLALRKEVSFAVRQAGGAIHVDPARLKQVLLILLDNAFRYTPPGGQVALETNTANGRVKILISDTGVGIAPEHLPHVFERFYKIDQSAGEEYRGSGLGLSIAKSLVEAQGGTISLESQVGKGTRAAVTFPEAKG